MTLLTPSGRIIESDITASDVFHRNGPTYEFYSISNPEAGTWTIRFYGADGPPKGEKVIQMTIIW